MEWKKISSHIWILKFVYSEKATTFLVHINYPIRLGLQKCINYPIRLGLQKFTYLVFWSFWRHRKDISKLTDLSFQKGKLGCSLSDTHYEIAKIWRFKCDFRFFWSIWFHIQPTDIKLFSHKLYYLQSWELRLWNNFLKCDFNKTQESFWGHVR